jgi:hypothetical protein
MGAKKRLQLNQSLSPTPPDPPAVSPAMEAYMSEMNAKLDKLCAGLTKID